MTYVVELDDEDNEWQVLLETQSIPRHKQRRHASWTWLTWGVGSRTTGPSALTHPATKELLNNPFLHYNELSYVWRPLRTSRQTYRATTIVSPKSMAWIRSSPLYSLRMNMLPEDMMSDRSSRSNDRRTIAKWPEKAITREDAMEAQVIENMQSIPSLTMAEKSKCVVIVTEKVSLMRNFIKMSDPMKVAYCRVLLGYDP
ncbi:retrotransposon protein [Cucumis melo var. makuwa]|uniref:Retrotransposon protein n=1 Tax=Cucumis melo var. makuwa TaxID=1194695 RepID=A0A5D3DYD1_CUCMM|nr:retrotransposon protein [Cucumis melo var. makuwa]